MRLIDAGEKGISVKLSDQASDKIYTDIDDNGEHVVIVKGRIVRVDTPSPQMGEALTRQITPPGTAYGKGYPLLVETDESPTRIAEPLNVQLQKADKEQAKALLEAEAARFGFSLQESPVDEGDATDLRNGKRIAGQTDKVAPNVAPPAPTDSGSTDSKK
jgi:hypothetical protein